MEVGIDENNASLNYI